MINLRFCLSVVFVFASFYTLAHVMQGPAPPMGSPPPDPGPAPISGIEILLGLGALFGVKRIFTINKKDTGVK